MRKYQIKYEDLSGEVHTVERSGFSEQHAKSQVSYVKEFYWVHKL